MLHDATDDPVRADHHAWTAAQRDLWRRLERFQVGRDGVALTFLDRLARENGWTPARAAQVYREYLRFVFLAIHAGHPVTPSEAVDQAWHLHLTYTRSYWHDLCRELLGRDLHHGPTEGGPAEHAKFVDWYARTLDSYRRRFGIDPDPAVWPAPARRFAHAGDGRWVRRSEVVTIPRTRAWLGAAATAAAALLWSDRLGEIGALHADVGLWTLLLMLAGFVLIATLVSRAGVGPGHRRRRGRGDDAGSGWTFFGGCGTGGHHGGDDGGDGSGGSGGGGCGGGGCGGD